MTERIDMNVPAEEYARGADPRVAALEKDVVRVEIRTTALEVWKNTIEIANAARAERDKNVDAKLDRIEGTLTWLNRIVIGAVILAITMFALKGGFSHLPDLP
jgi:hypothetical protein